MNGSFLDSAMSAIFMATPELGMLVDSLLKSIVIFSFTALLIAAAAQRLTSAAKHLLWLNIFVCSASLPLLALVEIPAGMLSEPTPVLFSVGVSTTASNSLTSYADGALDLGGIVLVGYMIPACFLLMKLIASAIRIYGVGRRAWELPSQAAQRRLVACCQRLRITRRVRLNYSEEISSPLSFGLFSPRILLPISARAWKPAVLDDVLAHELSHIRRLDWLSMIFAYVVSSLLWLNPLLWLALRKLNEEAENSCDSSVLHCGQSETTYAEHLLDIARGMQGEPRKQFLAQMMLDRSMLPNRIHRLLENDMAKVRTHRLFALPLLLLTTAVLLSCTSTRLMEVQADSRPPPSPNRESREEILPTTAIAPQYPLRAAYGGIEGWALTEFTVLANGDVDPDSITVVDAEPADIFNRASIRAARRFKFEATPGNDPREIAGVQYLFRFELGEPREGEGAINRTLEPINTVSPEFPTQAESAGIEGGSVWTVFHVTREGTVQDVTVNYSSDDVFDESAIDAAQQLQFAPRSPGERIDGAVTGDTTGLVRAQYLFRFAR